jgi:hypothetical protein
MGGFFKMGNLLTGPMPKGVAGTALDPTTALDKLRGDNKKRKPAGQASTDLIGTPVMQPESASNTLLGT